MATLMSDHHYSELFPKRMWCMHRTSCIRMVCLPMDGQILDFLFVIALFKVFGEQPTFYVDELEKSTVVAM